MRYSPSGRQRRTSLSRFAIVGVVMSLMLFGLAPGAWAAIDTDDACPDPRNAGFVDTLQYPRDVREAINCLADYDITQGTSRTTFAPGVEVSRWQMALFLIRQAEIHGIDLPSGSSRGFTDIGGLPASTQRAINQLVQLNIAEGTGAARFSPDDPVTRWQMALFLTRLLDAAGIRLPSGTPQGFFDILVFPAETEKAINQLAQLRITEGTAKGQFSPDGFVTRWQMALFLTRTLEAGGVTPETAGVGGGGTKSAPKVGAPDLERVRFVDSDDARDETRLGFEFDETVAKTVDRDHFWLVGWDGTLTQASAASNSNDDDYDEVQADFDTSAYENAVAAAVTPGAVEDIDDLENTMGSYGLRQITVDSVDWPDDYPELVSVGRYDEDEKTVEFEFDLEEELEDDNDDLTLDGSDDDFYLVDEDGEIYRGDGDVDIEHNVVTVEFPDLSQSEWNAVVRGFVARGAVGEPGGLGNLPVAVDVSDSGRTDTPYITDVDLSDIDDGIVVFEFDQGLSPIANDSGNFMLVLHDGTVLVSEDEDRNDDDRNEVIVEFNGGAQLSSDLIIYATALDGAVDGFSSDPSAPDTYKMKYTFGSGDTAGPDLLSSEGTRVGLNSKTFRIVFTFDEDIDEGNTTFDEDVHLLGWDEDGDLVDISGGEVSIEDEVMTIEFDETDTGFDELEDDEVVRFGIYADEIADEFGFTSYPDGIGCDCDK